MGLILDNTPGPLPTDPTYDCIIIEVVGMDGVGNVIQRNQTQISGRRLFGKSDMVSQRLALAELAWREYRYRAARVTTPVVTHWYLREEDKVVDITRAMEQLRP